MLATFQSQDWVENFRMGQDSFLYLCGKLHLIMFRQDTRFWRPISVEQRVAIRLWCFATYCEHLTIAHLFGISKSSVCVIVHDKCHVIVSTLLIHYIKFPVGESLKSTWWISEMVGFSSMYWGYRWFTYSCSCSWAQPYWLLQL